MEEEPGEEGPAAGVLLGSLVVVVVLVLVLALLVRCLWARRGQEGHRGRGKSRGYAPPEKPGGGLSGEYWAGLPGGGRGGHCLGFGSRDAGRGPTTPRGAVQICELQRRSHIQALYTELISWLHRVTMSGEVFEGRLTRTAVTMATTDISHNNEMTITFNKKRGSVSIRDS